MPALHDHALARVAAGKAPATALAAYSRGVPAAAGLAGNATSAGAAPTTTTAFRIASCTKSFTAAAILILRDRGRLRLDDDVANYLPMLNLRGPDGSAWPGGMTVRMLLSMSGGLPTDDPWADRQESMSGEDFSRLLAGGVRLVRPPGAGYEYSNLGYAMLGRIIELASESPYTDFVTQELLLPLRLAGTAFSQGEILAVSGRATEVAAGYRRAGPATADSAAFAVSGPAGVPWKELPQTGPGAFSCIGGLYSTLDDLGRWTAWLSDAFSWGADDGPLSRASRREMQTMHQLTGPPEPDGTINGYGYGLVVQEHSVHGTIVGHSGGYPGFSSHMRWHPGHSLAVIGFENATYANVGLVVRPALEELLDRVDPHGPARGACVPSVSPSWNGPELPAEVAPWPETLAAIADVEDMVRALSLPGDGHLFSPNVALDVPWPERLADLHAALAAVGPILPAGEELCRGERPTWSTPAAVQWTMPAGNGALKLRITMTPVNPPQVQLLEISATS